MSESGLFGPVDSLPAAQTEKRAGELRLVTANRGQIQWGPIDLDARLPQDHHARLFWDLLGGLDLSRFYDWIKARGSSPGRPPTDPKILLALWLLATSEGIGSANELAELCTLHDAYRWICGGVSVCDHLLSDFRTEKRDEIDDLMTQVLAVLIKQGVLTVERVAHDGMRVRASAGAASFRGEESLEKCAAAARAHLEDVRREAADPANNQQRSKREAAQRERGARERLGRVEEALRQLPEVKAAKLKAAKRKGGKAYREALGLTEPSEEPAAGANNGACADVGTKTVTAEPGSSTAAAKKKSEPRVSTTDPDARVTKMADGGFRPAYNVHFATDTKTRVIVGVLATNVGSDGGQMTPMLADISARTEKTPKDHLSDGGFVKLEDIDRAEAAGTRVYAPVPNPNSPRVDPYKPKTTDGPGTADWRQRMATPEAKEIYKQRAATAETVNADLRVNRGLDRLTVRGLPKVLSVTLLSALTYNLLQPVVIAAIHAIVR